MARERGIISIVDGAHAFAHVPFKFTDIDCDFYGASLHKWLSAPIGTGMLYVRKDRIEKHWALMAAPPSMDKNIRKYEEIGTHPAAMHNAILQALEFHEQMGDERKFARLCYLKNRWADRLANSEGRQSARRARARHFRRIWHDSFRYDRAGKTWRGAAEQVQHFCHAYQRAVPQRDSRQRKRVHFDGGDRSVLRSRGGYSPSRISLPKASDKYGGKFASSSVKLF